MAKDKPLLWGANTSVNVQEHEANEFAYEHFSPAWVPGYDEHLKANEIAQNPLLTQAQKEHLFSVIGAGPKKLPIRVAWVRVTAPDGGRSYNANVDLSSWRRRGYRPANVETLTAAGMRVPDTAWIDSDGTIRREDTALWFVDEERAARGDRERDRFNAEFHALKAAPTGNAEVPYIEVEEQAQHRQLTLSEIKEK
jgi:hypothetical protein